MTSPIYCPNCGTQAESGRFCVTCAFDMGAVRGRYEGAAASLRTTDGWDVPLLGVALGGEVFGAHARMVLRQRYKNRETKPIEAVYTFPIPSDATLTGFAMECEGRRIEAEVKEREEAFATYDAAISKGHGAALLEQERPNVFTASVGNLLPDEETVIEVTFLQKLTADEGALRLMVPTLVAPRYIPGTPSGDRTGHGTTGPTNVVPDADRITPAIGAVRYGLTMDIVFDLGREVTIESPSHAIHTIAESGQRQRVTFTSQTVALDRDIVLVAEGAPGVTAGLVCDKPTNEEGSFALTIVPDLFEAKKRSKGRAVVFVVDVSGSMAGDSIEQARRALRLCLRHLAEGDLFDILPFYTGYNHFSAQLGGGQGKQAGLVRFTQTTLQQADEYVDGLQANGGTEMLRPLIAATKLLEGIKRDRVIVLLTDGQVGNEQQIVDEVSKQTAGARVYTFGIGTNVSDLLLRDLAKRTKGAVELIHPGERIDDKVTAQFARATAARVDSLSLKWVGVDAGEVAPSDPPALVDGEPWSVYGRYETPGLGHVEIRGDLGGEAFYAEVPLDLTASAQRPALASLWAGARVRDLEQVDPSSLGRRAEAHKKRIIELCVRHKIASKYTSFVVVEKRTAERRAQGQPETRAVPVNAPAGWAMSAKGRAEGSAQSQTRAGVFAPKSAVPRSPAPAAGRGDMGGRHTNMTSRAAPPGSAAPRGIVDLKARLGSSTVGGAPPPPAGYVPPPPPDMPGQGVSPPFAMGPQGNHGAPAPQGGFGPPPPPPAMGAPPPPRRAAPPPPMPAQARSVAGPAAPAAAAPAPAKAAPAPAKAEGGGFFERAKKALGLSKEAPPPPAPPAQAFANAAPADTTLAPAPLQEEAEVADLMDSAAPSPIVKGEGGGKLDIGAAFAGQLASGLWESGDPSEKGRLVATTACLSQCAREGIDTSHAVYGTQLTKAVEALSALAEALAQKGEAEAEVIRALLAMAAVSSGKRARGRIAAIAQAAASAAIKAVAADLTTQEAAKKRLLG